MFGNAPRRISSVLINKARFAAKPGEKIIGSKLGTLISAKDVLRGRKDVFKVSEGKSIEEAAEMLHKNNIGALLCCTGDFAISGVFSERDLVRVIGEKIDMELPVKTVMTPKDRLIACDIDEKVENMISTMLSNNIRHIGIRSVKGGAIDGFVSIKDCVGALQDETDVGAFSLARSFNQKEFAKMGVGAAFRGPTSSTFSNLGA